jgi:type VI secretion system protein ImpF
MNRVDSQLPLLPSVLDRLIDEDPSVSTEPAWQQSQSVRDYELSVVRDLEALLNTRQTLVHASDEAGELSQSVLTYGMPDFTSAGVGSAREREQLRQAIERAIRRFEPRLRQVRVSLHPPKGEFDRTLHMTIDGMLSVQPNPQPISFETTVQPSSGQCQIKPR